MRPGTRVEVRSTFDGSWVPGFEVVEQVDGDGDDDDANGDDGGGYRLKRLSDGELLPTVFPTESVRRAARREMWWVQ